jgi:pilus assembly protein CpaC
MGTAGRGYNKPTGKRLPAALAALTVAATALLMMPLMVDEALAQRLIQISGARRTASISVTVGKTEDVRIDAAFSDVTVGDPEVADVTPLTDHTLSILGRKIGTTRITVYTEGKKQVGILDVEVSYGVSRLATEIRAVPGSLGAVGIEYKPYGVGLSFTPTVLKDGVPKPWNISAIGLASTRRGRSRL